MKKTSIGLTLLIFIIFLFFSVDDFFLLEYMIYIKVVCVVCGCIDVYLMMDINEKNKEEEAKCKQNEVELLLSGQQKISESVLKFEENIKELVKSLSIEINSRNEEQKRLSVKYLEKLEGELNVFLASSNERFESTIMKIVDSEKENTEKISVLLREVSDKNTDMYENCLNEIRTMNMTQEKLVSIEQELRAANKTLFLNINNAMNGFVQVSGRVEEEISALKMYTKVFEDRLEAKVNDHYDKMEEGMEDGNEELQEILIESGKKQMDAYTVQTKALEKCIGHIETVINQTIGEFISRNDSLLSNIERMQDEWTSLNKDEIEFLNKIWEEK